MSKSIYNRVYHILFKYDGTSKGENFEAIGPDIAYNLFRNKYPNNIFIAIYDLKALGELKLNSNVIQEQAEVDDVIRANKENYSNYRDAGNELS